MLRIESWQESDPSLAAPMRDRLPTLPCDLAEYARIHTGPFSWSAASDRAPCIIALDDPFADLFERT